MYRKKYIWNINKRKFKRKKEKKLKKEKVLETDLNCYILQVSSGEIVCNEAKMKLCNDES